MVLLTQKPCALLIGVENDYPLFGRLEDIFTRILFYVTLLETVQAYVITYTSQTNITQLQSHIPMYIHRVSSRENDPLNLIASCMWHLSDIYVVSTHDDPAKDHAI